MLNLVTRKTILWSDQAIEALDADEIRKITGQYFLMVQDFTDPRADWVLDLYKEIDDEQASPTSAVAPNPMEMLTKIIVFYDDPKSKERPSERQIEFSGSPTADKSLEDLPFVVRMTLAEEIDLSESIVPTR